MSRGGARQKIMLLEPRTMTFIRRRWCRPQAAVEPYLTLRAQKDKERNFAQRLLQAYFRAIEVISTLPRLFFRKRFIYATVDIGEREIKESSFIARAIERISLRY